MKNQLKKPIIYTIIGAICLALAVLLLIHRFGG